MKWGTNAFAASARPATVPVGVAPDQGLGGAGLGVEKDFAPAHAEDLAAHALRGLRAEPGDYGRDVTGLELERARLVAGLRLVGRLDGLGHPGMREGRHRVRRNAGPREVHRRDPGQPDEAGLGAGVGALAEIAVEARARGDVDDAAPAVGRPAPSRLGVFAHHWGCGVEQVKRRGQIGRDDPVPVGGIGLEDEAVAQDGRVVDHDVEAAECVYGEGDRLGGLGGRGNARRKGPRVPAQFGCRLLRDRRIRPLAVYRSAVVGDDQLGAAPGELAGDGEPDAARAAGDHGDAAIEAVRIGCLVHPVISSRAFSAAV